MGILAALLRIAALPLFPIPAPHYHDEFSYLLGAETFASGRIANSPHPHWEFFETFHVNHHPTYSSKYPPGQATFLAAGKVLFGHPWYGVLIGLALMSGTACWMLQSVTPRKWAISGSMIQSVQLGITSYWANSYWGGALAAAGGALLCGGLIRARRDAGVWNYAAVVAGVMLLSQTRPFEGAVTVLAVIPLFWLRKRPSIPQSVNWRALTTSGILAGACVAGIAYYNLRLTGDPLLLPHSLHNKEYAASPHFYFMDPVPTPSYRLEVFKRLWADWDKGAYLAAKQNPGIIVEQFWSRVCRFFWTPLSFLLSITAILLLHKRSLWAAGSVATVAGALLLEKGLMPHYFAPVTCLIAYLFTSGFRILETRVPLEKGLRTLLTWSLAGALAIHGALNSINSPFPRSDFGVRREALQRRLASSGEEHLVFVAQEPEADIHESYVYNAADIDGSRVVWAHDLGKVRNLELIRYYPRRVVWYLRPTQRDGLVRYEAGR